MTKGKLFGWNIKWKKHEIELSEAFSVFIIHKIASKVQKLRKHFVLAYILNVLILFSVFFKDMPFFTWHEKLSNGLIPFKSSYWYLGSPEYLN